jgi:hypothetical protein
MSSAMISRVLELDDGEREILFKPVQLRVLRKSLDGKRLTENEKRYLRGRLGKKIAAMEHLVEMGEKDPLKDILSDIGEYYITGYEALKLNGFGWYYDTKRVEVVNTRIEGRLHVGGRSIRFIRVRSLGKGGWVSDGETGIRYAKNERIIDDARRLGNEALFRTCLSHIERYGRLFVERPGRYKRLISRKRYVGKPSDYGV